MIGVNKESLSTCLCVCVYVLVCFMSLWLDGVFIVSHGAEVGGL